MKYYQLQTVSSYSFYKSSVKVDEYVKKLKIFNYEGGAISDLNVIYSYPYLSDACNKEEMKPIYAMMAKFTIGSEVFNGELVVLDENGYKQLVKLINSKRSIYSLEDFEVSSLAFILKTEDEKFKDKEYLDAQNDKFYKLSKAFGRFYFGIEIYSNEDREKIEITRDFVRDHSYDSLAFPKVLYLDNKDSYKTYVLLRHISEKTKFDGFEENPKAPFFLLTPRVLSQLYKEDEIAKVEELVDSLDFTFFISRGGLIHYDDEREELRKRAFEGLQKKNKTIDDKHRERLEYELKVIDDMNYSSYFLIVEDYVNYAKTHDIKVGPGRGSSAGSLVAYSLDITALDPIKYDLYFERFLNPLRQNMPDIDIDFEDSKREEIIDYLRYKYGDDHVTLIVAFQTLKLRSSLNAIAEICDVSPSRIATLSKALSFKATSFKEELKTNYRFAKVARDPYFSNLIELSELVLGYQVNTSIHAAGVIISRDSVLDNLPLLNEEQDIACFEYQNLERMDYLKVDILALSNLSFLKNIENDVFKRYGKRVDILENLKDINTYDVLNRSLLVDIFQLESEGMNNTIRNCKPHSLRDLADLIALYRPGPMKNIDTYARRKNFNEKYVSKSLALNEILRDTYGIIIYQEQIISIAKAIASFDGAKADLFRQAISKKQYKKMEALKEDFVKGALKNGYSNEEVEYIYSLILDFASYGFNKNHAYSYALLTYNLAYLKANYPVSFYLNSLNKVSLNDPKFIRIKHELYEFAYSVVKPSINRSLSKFNFEDGNFYVGFDSIKGLTPQFKERILKEREKGPYEDLFDFLSRNNIHDDDKSNLVNLIKAGAFDEFDLNRQDLLIKLNDLLMASYFATSASSMPEIARLGKFKMEDFENEMSVLGVVLSMKIDDFIEGDKKYSKLYIVTSSPIYFGREMKVEVIDNYRRFQTRMQSHELNKGDIISCREVYSKEMRHMVIETYTKEKIKDE